MGWHRGPSQTNDQLLDIGSNSINIFKQNTTSNRVVELNIYTLPAYISVIPKKLLK